MDREAVVKAQNQEIFHETEKVKEKEIGIEVTDEIDF